MHFGGPVLIEELFKADLFDILVLLRPRQMMALHLNLYAHLGCRRNLSIHELVSVIVRCEETEDIRVLDWCPRPVAFPV